MKFSRTVLIFAVFGGLVFIISCINKDSAKEIRPMPEAEPTAQEKAAVEVYGATENKITVADFNRGSKPNNLNEDFGAWNKDPQDTTQGCVDSFDQANVRDNLGYCLKLVYDVDSPNPAYNGFWMKLGGLDLRKFNNLVFYVKGDSKNDFTGKFKVELKTPTQKGSFTVKGIDEMWQKVVIPLREFKEISDLSNVQELVIVFDDITVTKKKGIIYIDDIYFE